MEEIMMIAMRVLRAMMNQIVKLPTMLLSSADCSNLHRIPRETLTFSQFLQ
jgi:hypothetical protein